MEIYRSGLCTSSAQTDESLFLQWALDRYMHELAIQIKEQMMMEKERDHADLMEKAQNLIENVKRKLAHQSIGPTAALGVGVQQRAYIPAARSVLSWHFDVNDLAKKTKHRADT